MVERINCDKESRCYIFKQTQKGEDILRKYFGEFSNYNCIINVHDPPRYHEVAALIRKDKYYAEIDINLGIISRNDTKTGNPVTGHIITFQLDDQYILDR